MWHVANTVRLDLGLHIEDVSGMRSQRKKWADVQVHLAKVKRAEVDIPRFMHHPAPAVSIVIPVFGKLELTLACLHSVALLPDATTYEVIVVDDASEDETADVLSGLAGLRLLRNTKNEGFIASCNRGAAHARAALLVFLNNDTIVLPGWLDELIDTHKHVPNVGLAGSRLIYPTGRLQECGGIVWSDASACNWGNGHDPWNPRFSHLRDVDYCSGASIAINSRLFLELGGFDPRYAPAYYEDTDLAFKVRTTGKRVVVQPRSTLIHFEGGTAGRNTRVGPKRYQLNNQVKFLERWRDVLRDFGVSGDRSAKRVYRGRKRALIVDDKHPTPDTDSGSIDCVNMLKILDALQFGVTFTSVSLSPLANLRTGAESAIEPLERMGVACPRPPYQHSLEAVLQEIGAQLDLVVLSRASIAWRYLNLVRKHAPRAKIVFNPTDLASVREERQHAVHPSTPVFLQSHLSRHQERYAASRADATIVLSTAEQQVLQERGIIKPIRVVPLIRAVPARSDTRFKQRAGVMFVGGFKHRPNIDAVHHLVRDIWPFVRAVAPHITLHIVGSATPPEISQLAVSDIVVHGFVKNIAAFYQQMRVSVAPLRFGAGLKGKVAESLMFGVPSVCTSIAVEGSGLTTAEVAIADAAEDLATQIVRVHEDEIAWSALASSGYEFAKRTYDVPAIQAKFVALLTELHVLP